MSAYIKLQTLEYPRYEGDIRLEYPNILESQTGSSFPCPEAYAVVQPVDRPEINIDTQVAYELPPINNNGTWVMVWAVRNLTQEELTFIEEQKKNQDPRYSLNLAQQGNQPNVIG
jgi:hypothetical protein